MSDESDETRSFSPLDETEADSAAPPSGDTPTRTGSDSTKMMPPAADDDWAASRAKPVWSGRAEVRAPQSSSYDIDWQIGPTPVPSRRDRWWMPIVVGIVVLILLALLGWGLYLIVQNSGDDGTTPATTPTTTAAVTTAPATTTPPSEPTAIPETPPPTTEPTTSEVLVPALRGLTLDDARDALNQTGLHYRVLYRSSTAPAGTVIDSDPAEGQEVPPDTRVTIVVSGTATPSTTSSASAGTGG